MRGTTASSLVARYVASFTRPFFPAAAASAITCVYRRRALAWRLVSSRQMARLYSVPDAVSSRLLSDGATGDSRLTKVAR